MGAPYIYDISRLRVKLLSVVSINFMVLWDVNAIHTKVWRDTLLPSSGLTARFL